MPRPYLLHASTTAKSGLSEEELFDGTNQTPEAGKALYEMLAEGTVFATDDGKYRLRTER